VFGALAQMGGKLVRCMGIVRTTLRLHLTKTSSTDRCGEHSYGRSS
jgi:hypothetical protein